MAQEIVRPVVSILSVNGDMLKQMYIAAKNCYYPGDVRYLEDFKSNGVNLLKKIYSKGHLSIFEQSFIQYYLKNVSRSFMAQLTRHRVGWSFAIQSQHYQMMNDFNYKYPEIMPADLESRYVKLMGDINELYKEFIDRDIPRHIAREVLPNSCAVNIVTSTNLRALFHFFDLRCGNENTLEMRLVANSMKDKLFEKYPDLNDIYKVKNG